MKKLLAFIAAITLSVMALGVQAQKPSPGKMGGMPAPKMMQPVKWASQARASAQLRAVSWARLLF